MGLLKANTHGRLKSAIKPVNPETKGADLQRVSMNFHTTFTSTDQCQQSWGFVSQAFFLACSFDLQSNSDFFFAVNSYFQPVLGYQSTSTTSTSLHLQDCV